MSMRLEGSCRCGAVSFSVDSHTPYPYQRCYCSICRKSAGGGGYAINIMGVADTLIVKGNSALGVWNAPIDGHRGSADRHYCKILDALEVGPTRLPIIRVAHDFDGLVGLVFDEFEGPVPIGWVRISLAEMWQG